MRFFGLFLLIVIGVAGYFAHVYFSTPQTFDDGSVAKVDRYDTQAQICVTVEGDCTSAAESSSIFLKNHLVTDQDGRLRASMIDTSLISLGPETELTIDEFVFQPRTIGTFLVALSSGSFRMVTGVAGDAADKNLTVETDVATIGVRGTDFVVRQLGNAVDVVLITGEVDVSNDAGTVTLTSQGDYAVVLGPDSAPVAQTALPPGQIVELLSATAFDDELADLLNPNNNYQIQE